MNQQNNKNNKNKVEVKKISPKSKSQKLTNLKNSIEKKILVDIDEDEDKNEDKNEDIDVKENNKIIEEISESESEDNQDNKDKPARRIKKISETPEYERPIYTYTDLLTKKDIQNKLIDYVRIKDISEVNESLVGKHCRYFLVDNGEYKFRTGGVVTVVNPPDYLIMSNHKITWSVQLKNCVLFKRLTTMDVKEEYEKVIIDKDNKINELMSFIKVLQQEINDLKKPKKTKK